MPITKKDFIYYLKCPQSFWVYKKDTDNYTPDEVSRFVEKLIRDSEKVEDYFQAHLRVEHNNTEFRKTFQVDNDLLTSVSGFRIDDGGNTYLYEVKSSKTIRNDRKHNHLKDACFQMIVAERSGQRIDYVIIVHVNGDYVRDGDIRPDELLVFEDVTDDVRAIKEETDNEINDALNFLSNDTLDGEGCSCIYKSRSHHCDTFEYLNPNIPELSIYNLPRLSEPKRHELIASNRIDLHNVPADYDLTDIQARVLLAAHAGEPQTDRAAITNLLNAYQFPLYFFDYETYASAVPLINNISPHTQFPTQYSLHVLQEDGTLTDEYFLQRVPQLPRNLVEKMEDDFGDEGSVVVWSPFEKQQNDKMAEWFPDKADFLNNINSRVVDLMDIFKEAYVDARFGGSTSIKKVLPVICPHLTYDNLNIMDGADAMDAWEKMISANGDEADQIASDLLTYCHLDTLAMVDIYKFLKEL